MILSLVSPSLRREVLAALARRAAGQPPTDRERHIVRLFLRTVGVSSAQSPEVTP